MSTDDALRETDGADMAQNRLLLAELGWHDLNNALITANEIPLAPDEMRRLELVRRLKGLLAFLENTNG